MQTTLAVIPFGANTENQVYLRTLQEAMAATIASLLQYGIGRVVVVGHFVTDSILVQNVFLQLQVLYDQTDNVIDEIKNSTLPFQVDLKRQLDDGGETIVQQLAFVHTTGDGKLVPKESLRGLQQALQGKVDSNGQEPEIWLGPKLSTKQQQQQQQQQQQSTSDDNNDHHYPWKAWKWEYIYFTEPDQIVNARFTPSFLEAMDEGGIVMPHRLQPIPHRSDFSGLSKSNLAPFPRPKRILSMDPELDACCDLGYESNTGIIESMKANYPGIWWGCFYDDGAKHMQDYDLIRVTTGVVHIAADGHARKCRPVKGGRGTCIDVTKVV
ncbi:hypothetical protein IV203_034327 [Nitzschia inconspicua]|uniref:Uncharacterized protein n=1 Tax=Nitzschia inconspicua TaxID=303405 RepID=A0A9K3Q798_9STRA|nr:hypothetical protein IV203_034327 [Nitzschia inconspicua]